MKKLVLMAAFLLAGSVAQATGFTKNVFSCHSIINGPSIKLTQFSTSAPGGPVHTYFVLSQTDHLGKEVSFRLEAEEKIITEGGNAALQNYVAENYRFGTFKFLKINGRFFIDANLSDLRSPDLRGFEREIKTNGLLELKKDYFICK